MNEHIYWHFFREDQILNSSRGNLLAIISSKEDSYIDFNSYPLEDKSIEQNIKKLVYQKKHGIVYSHVNKEEVFYLSKLMRNFLIWEPKQYNSEMIRAANKIFLGREFFNLEEESFFTEKIPSLFLISGRLDLVNKYDLQTK